MSWALKPKLPDGVTFNGQLLYNSTHLEIEDTFSNYVQGVFNRKNSQYVIKYTGFQSKVYKKDDPVRQIINITLVGNLPRWLFNALRTMAEAINGAGMILQFKDNWITGTEASPVTYTCRWANASDFVENNTLLMGGTMQLIAFNIS
jgi:hypothetical protein